MIAIDTNVLVRIIVNDDPEQCQKALAALNDQAVYIPVTVILESEWVFRHCYGLAVDKVCLAFQGLLQAEGVEIAETEAVQCALALHENGMDFADALHLNLAAKRADAICTFDKAFVRSVPDDAAVTVQRL
jgi:predicted nucleic-acid-binding protein